MALWKIDGIGGAKYAIQHSFIIRIIFVYKILHAPQITSSRRRDRSFDVILKSDSSTAHRLRELTNDTLEPLLTPEYASRFIDQFAEEHRLRVRVFDHDVRYNPRLKGMATFFHNKILQHFAVKDTQD